jgi:peptide/nickel transport system permease protein
MVDAMLAASGGGDAGLIAELRGAYGLDQPVWVQLLLYLWRAIRLDFGTSSIYGAPVLEVVLSRAGNTVALMLASLALAILLGALLGIAAARRRGTLADSVIVVLGLVFYATPGFWVGLMLIVLFSVKLGWLPVGGLETIGAGLTGFAHALDRARHLAMPMASLSLVFLAVYLRLMRSSMIEAYGEDFVRTARAKGLSERRIAYAHVLRNALLPLVTMAGLQFGTLIGGSVVVESVFSLPGLGRLAYEAVAQRDLNTLLGVVLLTSVLVILANLVVDLLYARLDPRIEAA